MFTFPAAVCWPASSPATTVRISRQSGHFIPGRGRAASLPPSLSDGGWDTNRRQWDISGETLTRGPSLTPALSATDRKIEDYKNLMF